jgi:predicted glycosyltransferase
LHKRIYSRFDEVWVPDFEDEQQSLAGKMSHLKEVRSQKSEFRYMGPLSRFQLSIVNCQLPISYDVVAVLSGLEPHRTMLEKELVARYCGKKDQVLIVQGLMGRPKTTIKRGNITIVPYMSDEELAAALSGAKHIIARSGYSTIMDLHALGLLEKAEFIPTPGQPEQEYLAEKYKKKGK